VGHPDQEFNAALKAFYELPGNRHFNPNKANSEFFTPPGPGDDPDLVHPAKPGRESQVQIGWKRVPDGPVRYK
jgi:hypothetical protein